MTVHAPRDWDTLRSIFPSFLASFIFFRFFFLLVSSSILEFSNEQAMASVDRCAAAICGGPEECGGGRVRTVVYGIHSQVRGEDQPAPLRADLVRRGKDMLRCGRLLFDWVYGLLLHPLLLLESSYDPASEGVYS